MTAVILRFPRRSKPSGDPAHNALMREMSALAKKWDPFKAVRGSRSDDAEHRRVTRMVDEVAGKWNRGEMLPSRRVAMSEERQLCQTLHELWWSNRHRRTGRAGA